MVTVRLFRDCPWPRDYSEVVELTPSARVAYLESVNSETVTINGISVPGVTVFGDAYGASLTTGAQTLEFNVDVDPAVGNHITYCSLSDGPSTWFYWVDSIKFVQRHDSSYPAATADTVRLYCSMDIWAQYGADTELYDSYVERKHMPRWSTAASDSKPVYYTPKESVDGTLRPLNDDNSKMHPLREYITLQNGSGEIIYDKTEKKCWLEWGIVYGSIGAGTSATNPLLAVIGIVGSVIIATGGEYSTNFNRTSFWINGTDGQKEIHSTSILESGDLYRELGISENNSTLFSAELVMPLGKAWYAAVRDTGGILVVFENNEIAPRTNFATDPDKWMIDASFFMSGQAHLYFPPFACPEKPSPPASGHLTYDEKYEPMLYQTPARETDIIDSGGGLAGKFSDLAVLSYFGTDQVRVTLIPDFTATTVNISLGDDHERTMPIDLIYGKGVSVSAVKATVCESTQLVYRNTQYNADRQLKETQKTCAAINMLGSVASSVAMPYAFGGKSVGQLAAAGMGVSSLTSGYTSMTNIEAQFEAQQTKIANQPNEILFAAGIELPYTLGWIYAIVQRTLDTESYTSLKNMLYLKGIKISRMVRGTIDLHTRVGFDYIQCGYARVKVPAPTDIQMKLKDIFEAGVRIYHDLEFFEQDHDTGTAAVPYENYEVGLT